MAKQTFRCLTNWSYCLQQVLLQRGTAGLFFLTLLIKEKTFSSLRSSAHLVSHMRRQWKTHPGLKLSISRKCFSDEAHICNRARRSYDGAYPLCEFVPCGYRLVRMTGAVAIVQHPANNEHGRVCSCQCLKQRDLFSLINRKQSWSTSRRI